ncbi:putative methyltransferase DDB_G0268948 [Argiope bruennichi]|uniref:putative methyltransferase DDB_G0268948 n=1 Tax=Argiope bruennichi TaxID=94029 RepID=UPI002493EE2A|nr:putative methyltransferase DDB_G0268948 [Argiope bruennichi]XP_055949606.1 putative methyltransferase DDB_G0268948 [Argiope bruennichi]
MESESVGIMSDKSKQFGEQYDANVYSSYRKDTPVELIEKIIDFLKEKVPEPLETAVDVGCGNGQSTVILAPYFKQVHGSDVSEAQIEQAKANRSLPNVTYAAGPAEKLPFCDGSVQLLTAATALHWFDLDTFLPEARRVLCVNGVMAVYGYLNMKPLFENPTRAKEVDELFDKYCKVLEPHHVMSKVSILQNRYKDVKFPFEEVNRCPDVRCCFEGKLPDVVNYVSTWSGYQNFKKVDNKGAEELLDYFRKRLYEIGATCSVSPEDSVTLYRDFQLILCRKTKDGSFAR